MCAFLCPLCQAAIEVKTTKKGKPYAVCEDCGMQLFVRYSPGINRLTEITKTGSIVLHDFVICTNCQVAVKKCLRKIQSFLGMAAGIYCPECERLLVEAPDDWREQVNR